MGLRHCYAPDCPHTNKDPCHMYKLPKTPQRKMKWLINIMRGDRLPTQSSYLCSCHFVDGVKGYNMKKTPTIFKRNLEYRHLFRDPNNKKARKKLLELETVNESAEEDSVTSHETSGVLSARNSTAGDLVLDCSQTDELGVSALSDDISHLENNADTSSQGLPLHSSTPFLMSRKTTQQRQEEEDEEPWQDQSGFEKRETPKRRRGSHHWSSPSSPGHCMVINMDTLTRKTVRKTSATQTDGPLRANAYTQVARGGLLLTANFACQTDSCSTKSVDCQTSVVSADNPDACAIFGSNMDAFKYLIQENQEWVGKVYRIEQAKKSVEEQCTAMSECIKDLKEESQNLKNDLETCKKTCEEKVSEWKTKFCTSARRVVELEEELNVEKSRLLYQSISSTDVRVQHFTGLPNARIFNWLCDMFPSPLNFHKNWRVQNMSREDQLFMTLMKLRLNFDQLDLATWFDVSRTTVANVVYTWIDALHKVLYVGAMVNNVPSKFKVQKSLPACFKGFENCRMVIDCTEVGTSIPKSMGLHNLLWSNYKHRVTLKGLVGVAPNGTVVFLSSLYPGSTSDKEIVLKSKLLDVFEPGDSILADKGFLIKDNLPKGVTLNLPPFLTQEQFTEAQVERTKSIARARIHVERAIKRIKDYRILDHVPHYLYPCSSKVWQVCGSLTNLMNPLLAEVEESLRGVPDTDINYNEFAEGFDILSWDEPFLPQANSDGIEN